MESVIGLLIIYGGNLVIMGKDGWNDIFTSEVMTSLFPKDRANQFFDALFGDPSG
jgi:hypothetical protein